MMKLRFKRGRLDTIKKTLKFFYVIELIFTGGQSKQITESIKFVEWNTF